MNRKLIPAVAGFMILLTVLSMTPSLSFAQTTLTFGPQLQVTTIPQDDQVREKGIMILGLDTAIDKLHGTSQLPEYQCLDATSYAAAVKAAGGIDAYTGPPMCGPQDLMSQHKLLVTYNGLPMSWHIGSTEPQPLVFCNFVEKDKVNVVPDPKTGDGKQGSWENLMTAMVDVSNDFVCKVRWKSPAPGVYESVGVLDVYYKGAFDGHYIADTILVVEATLTLGRTVIFGSDIQDICVLGWGAGYAAFATDSVGGVLLDQGLFLDQLGQVLQPTHYITKPDGTLHYIWEIPLGGYASCEDAALVQRQALGIQLATGQDPLFVSTV
jgi:hypothetical protein